MYLFVFACLFVGVFGRCVRLFACLFAWLFGCLFVCLFVCLSVCFVNLPLSIAWTGGENLRWVPPGCFLGASWVLPVPPGLLGASWVPTGCLLGASWVPPGCSWVPPGCSWVFLGASWVLLCALGCIPGVSWMPHWTRHFGHP